MGTQQILMIILSVIVVGSAIAIGIQMFDTQLENNTRQALAIELMRQASEAQAWYRIPLLMNGGGNGYNNATPPALVVKNALDIARYIDSTATNATPCVYRNLYGEFQLSTRQVNGVQTITILGISDVRDNIRAQAEFPLRGNGNNITITQL